MKNINSLYAIVEENGIASAESISAISEFIPLFTSKKSATNWMSKIKMNPGKKAIVRVEIKKYENYRIKK